MQPLPPPLASRPSAGFQDGPMVSAAALEALIWRPPEACGLSAAQRRWLLDEGSLTGRLRAQGLGFSLRLLGEGWRELAAVPTALGPGPYRERQVLLCLDHRPWVWGRTLMPAVSLQACPELGALGRQPLGEHLFRQADLIREPFELADFSASAAFCRALGTWGLACRRPLWGRRSLVRHQGSPLLICEVFLPDCPIYEEGEDVACDE